MGNDILIPSCYLWRHHRWIHLGCCSSHSRCSVELTVHCTTHAGWLGMSCEAFHHSSSPFHYSIPPSTECRHPLLSQLRHPNVIHFVGVHYDSNQDDMSLIMECLDTDLARCLETQPNIPIEVRVVDSPGCLLWTSIPPHTFPANHSSRPNRCQHSAYKRQASEDSWPWCIKVTWSLHTSYHDANKSPWYNLLHATRSIAR